MNIKCKIWAHKWNDNPYVFECAKCGFVEEYGEIDKSWNLENKYLSFKWNAERLITKYFGYEKCGYCKARRVRLFGRQISDCENNCVPF